MSSGYDHLVASLELRFDHVSARVVAREVLDVAGLEDKATYSKDESEAIAAALATLGITKPAVLQALGAGPGEAQVTSPAAPAAPAAPEAEEELPAAPVEETEAPAAEAVEESDEGDAAPAKKGGKKGGKKK